MVPARAGPPDLAVVLPWTLQWVVLAVAAAYDDVLGVRLRFPGQQDRTRRLRALRGEPAPLHNARGVGVPVGFHLGPEGSECGEDRKVGQVGDASAEVKSLWLVLPLEFEAVEEYRPAGL